MGLQLTVLLIRKHHVNLKMQRHDVNVSGKFTCVYSDRQNSISDEQQLMLH